jgi:YVTN family beta-propeller protein
MWVRALLCCAALSPAFFLAPTTTAEPPAAPKARPTYKSPLGVAVDEKGEKAYVALHTAGAVAVVDLKAGKVLKEIPPGPDFAQLSNPRPHIGNPYNIETVLALPRNHLPTTQTAQGWIFLNAIGRTANYGGLLPIPLDEPQRGYADPTDYAFAEKPALLFVASAGADRVLVVDLKEYLKYNPHPNLTWSGYNSLTASRHYVIARIPTQANPRRLALSGDGNTLVASNYLGDSLTVIDTKTLKVVRHIALGGPEPDAVRRGEILFNSGKMTFHGQFTCASCHPNGGSDGLTWDLTRDGVGNFKKTKSLLGVKDTAPYGWEGSSPTLEDRIAGTLRTLHQHEPEDTEVTDIAAYLNSLSPPLPLPVKDEDKPAVARGEKLFADKAQCAKCHQGPTFQDGKAHDVGTRGETDTTNRFDTPSLRGVGRERIFLHDGRAKTLEEVFTKHNAQKKHGAAHELSKDELADLLKYLSSL